MQRGNTSTRLGPTAGLSLSLFPTMHQGDRFRGQQPLANPRLAGDLSANSLRQGPYSPVFAMNWRAIYSLSNLRTEPVPWTHSNHILFPIASHTPPVVFRLISKGELSTHL